MEGGATPTGKNIVYTIKLNSWKSHFTADRRDPSSGNVSVLFTLITGKRRVTPFMHE